MAVEDDDGDVVLGLLGVRHIQEQLDQRRRPDALPQSVGDLLFLELIGEPIAAHQEPIARAEREGLDGDAYRARHPQRARDDALGQLHRALVRQVGRELEHVVGERVILREEFDLVAAEAVAAAVPNVRQVQDADIGLDADGDDGRAHPAEAVRRLGQVDDLSVGRLDGSRQTPRAERESQDVEAPCLGHLLHLVRDGGQRHRAGDVAGVLAACAVGEHVEFQLAPEQDRVLVVVTLTDMRVAGGDGAKKRLTHVP